VGLRCTAAWIVSAKSRPFPWEALSAVADSGGEVALLQWPVHSDVASSDWDSIADHLLACCHSQRWFQGRRDAAHITTSRFSSLEVSSVLLGLRDFYTFVPNTSPAILLWRTLFLANLRRPVPHQGPYRQLPFGRHNHQLHCSTQYSPPGLT
jgi:hypothetical protein